MEFDLEVKNKTFIRWKNWKNFIDWKIILNKSSEILLWFVTFNLSDKVIGLLDILKLDSKWWKYDILILDNNSEKTHFDKINNYINDNNLFFIKIIKTIDNLWWAWWNAIILEYFLKNNYSNLILTEDDAIPIDKNLVSEMIDSIDKDKVIRTFCNDSWWPSYPFHFTLYPKKLIENLWVMDPRYFMRSDDSEFHFKLDYIVNNNWFEYKLVNYRYTHPSIKKWFWKYWQSYFSIRNNFYTKERAFFNWKSKELWSNFFYKDFFRFFVILFFYFWTWILKIFIENDVNYLKVILLWIKDYIFDKYSYTYNKLIKNQLFWFQNKNQLWIINNIISIKELDKITKNKYLLDYSLTFQKTYNITFSNKIIDFLKNWSLISSFNLPTYPILFFWKKVVSIEEFLDNESVYIWLYKNKNYILNLFFTFLSFIIAFILYLTIMPIILLKIILFKITRYLWK